MNQTPNHLYTVGTCVLAFCAFRPIVSIVKRLPIISKLELIFSLLVITVFSTSCGNSGRGRKSGDNSPERTGVKILSEELKKYDASPSLSADGLKIVFISGRDETLQAYRYEVGGAGAQRVFEDDLGETIEVSISPDGTHIAAIINTEGSVDIYVTPFSQSTSPSKIDADDGSVESGLRFSHDSRFLMFNRRSANSANTSVYVNPITDGNVGDSVQISNSKENEFNIGWKNGVTYEAITSQKQSSSFLSDFVSRSFSSPSTISNESKVYENLNIDLNISPALSSSQLFFATPNLADNAELKPISPEGPGKADETMPIVSSISKINLSSSELSAVAASGFEVLSVSANSSGSLALVTSRNFFNCEEEKLTYGATMFLYNVALETFTKIYPVTKGDVTITSNKFCENDGDTDDRILTASLALDSTPESYKIVYVTYQSDDTEVRHFNVQTSGDTVTATHLSVSDN